MSFYKGQMVHQHQATDFELVSEKPPFALLPSTIHTTKHSRYSCSLYAITHSTATNGRRRPLHIAHEDYHPTKQPMLWANSIKWRPANVSHNPVLSLYHPTGVNWLARTRLGACYSAPTGCAPVVTLKSSQSTVTDDCARTSEATMFPWPRMTIYGKWGPVGGLASRL